NRQPPPLPPTLPPPLPATTPPPPTSPVAASSPSTDFRKATNLYLALTFVDEANGWCGGSLLGDQDESSEIYKHYAELCQGLDMNPFEKNHEIEQDYDHALQMGMIVNVDDAAAVEVEMEAVFKDFDKIGSISAFSRCKSLTGDPSQLTRWIIGEEKIGRTRCPPAFCR
ncbi:hypothetical protein Droror1_Dr00028175, partial [Drosera rotundifolia]